MSESPVLQNLLAENTQDFILTILESRFGSVPEGVVLALIAIRDNDRLRELVRVTAVCPDLEAFRREISP
jgi:hypothetical protein